MFWSSSYSDLRTENVITYSPNRDVTPMVTFGGSLTARTTVSATARELEAQGYRVVAGINGDFFNTSNGLPIGILVSEGQLLSSDAGYYAVGFREDGSAVIGKPGLSVTADLGYQLADSSGYAAEVIRTVTGVNKARVSTGGIYLYTYEFNDRHTTGNTEAGVDVVCTVTDGSLAIGSTLTAVVEQVTETAGTATAIGPDQIVLSANALSSSYHTDALRNIPAGTEITLTITAADEDWNDVVYACGALYSLVEDGSEVPGLPSGQNPRTAVGVKRDGTVVFYTIDGRRSGHSIGATLSQVARRLIELGCVAAVGLDGGGSTTLTVTAPDDTTVSTVNRPSDGSERKVTNHLFLVASSEPTGRLDHFYVQADYDYVLAGSKVEISAAAVDTNFIPMDEDYRLEASDGELDGNILTTPRRGGDITVTASHGRQEGTATVHAIANPTDLAIRNSGGTALTSLETTLGAVTQLTATAAWNHISLKADPEAFTWEVDGGIGTIDEKGNFTATAPGSGTITVSAGRAELSIPVTVSGTVSSGGVMAVEDFEGTTTIFRGNGGGVDFSLNHSADTVRMGRGSARIDYTLTEADSGFEAGPYTSQWRAVKNTVIDCETYSALHMWVYGDGSGNILSLLCSNGTKDCLTGGSVTLDFTGWKQVTFTNLGSWYEIQGLQVSAPATATDTGMEYADTPRSGTVYIDQITATASAVPDTTAPQITLTPDRDTLTASVADDVDGLLSRSSISVTWDGAEQDFSYDPDTGVLSASLISDGRPHRVTVTARDASGNIGRASYDVPTSADWTPSFTDTQGYWAATYVDFLYNAGITTGYDDSTFRPGQNISRQQFAVMLFRYLA